MEQMGKKIDRRIIKTKKAICGALLELMTQKDLNEITIKEIADTADINRKTFYNYYSGVHQVIDEIENEMVTKLNQALGEIDLKQVIEDPYRLFSKMTATVTEHLDYFGLMLRCRTNSNLLTKTTAAMKEKVHASLAAQTTVDIDAVDIMMEFTYSGMLAVYHDWFNSDRHKSIDEVSEIMNRLATWGVNGYLEKNKIM